MLARFKSPPVVRIVALPRFAPVAAKRHSTMTGSLGTRALSISSAAAKTWTGPYQLPTLQRIGSQIPSDISALEVARNWFNDFKQAIESKTQADALASLFLEEGFWRDLSALSWDFRSIQGFNNIAPFLNSRLSESSLGSLTLAEDALRAPAIRNIFPDLTFLQLCFSFETAVGRCSGICRLVNSGGTWKAYTMFTALDALRDFPEKVGALRDPSMYQGTWTEKRRAELNFVNDEPAVIIIGAGHSGLETAARLKHLGVRTLVVEKSDRVGDNWRNRYKTLCLHDPVWYDQMPYLPFPSPWPVYAPAPKLGDWLETYAQTLELDVWTSSRVQSAQWDDSSKSWNVVLERGGSTRLFKPNHIVFATGLGGGVPNIPDVPGQSDFHGQVLHSAQFTSAEYYIGKKIVIIGAANSAHDIAHDLANHGIDVTMFQRSSTFIISAKTTSAMVSGLYNESIPTHFADQLNASLPLAVSRQIHQRVFPHFASTLDKGILDGLASVGFKTNLGPDSAGLLPLLYGRAGGYYVDTGASQQVIDGKIKLKTSGALVRYTRTGVLFDDGLELPADVIIHATGYGDAGDARAAVKGICGFEVFEKLKPVWGLDDEGEIRSVWRDSGHEGLWFAIGNLPLSRYYSAFLAMRIKMEEVEKVKT